MKESLSQSLFIGLLLFLFGSGFGQSFVTLNGEFTMKEKRNQNLKLIKGRVSIDNEKRFIKFKLSFPQDETWILNDTIFEKYNRDSLVSSFAFAKWDDISFFIPNRK
ncbi:MAG: hypothetical protein KA341_10455 [Saprospiraceae bacterium]|nr:hypothetical protein [Saprospiraceae bacterium]